MDRLGEKRGFLCRLGQNKWLFLAFCVPVIVMAVAIAASGIYPFGNRVFLSFDAVHQYYPFMLEYREKMVSGQSLFHSWNVGLGSNFWAVLAYYCASPLNVLTLLVPESGVMVLYEALVAIKLGLAGFFCVMFLKKVFGRNDASVAAFGWMYALCGFSGGYFWCIMWLDTFALLPLLMLGLYALVKEGKFRLYVIALFLCLWCCYLIGLYACVFVFFSFFTMCLCLKLTGKQIVGRLVKIAVATVVAIAMAAILLLPVWMSLMHTTRAGSNETPFWEVNATFLQIFGNLGTAIRPTWSEGPPNVYTSLPAVLLAAVYFGSKKIPLRQKLCTAGMLVFLIVSFHWKGTESLWNMMRKTIMLPARFSFLFSFVLVVAGFQVLPQAMEAKKKDLLLMAGTGICLLVLIGASRGLRFAVVNCMVLVAYGVLLLLLTKKKFLPKLMCWGLGLVLVAELTVPLYRCVNQFAREDDHASFPKGKQEISRLLEKVDAEEQGDFYRVGLLPRLVSNDPALYRFRGANMFSSTMDEQMLQHMFMIGMASATSKNSYMYTDLNSPLTNAMVGIDYVIFNDQEAVNDGYLQPVAQEGEVCLYRNTTALSLGFMGENTMKDPIEEVIDPFIRQNDIFTAMTGVEKPIYTCLELKDTKFGNMSVQQYDANRYECTIESGETEGTVQCGFEMPRDGVAYVYVRLHYDAKTYEINGTEYPANISPHIICMGEMKQGEKIDLSWIQREENDHVMVYAAVLDKEVFDEGWKLLADEQMQVEYFDDRSVKGTIEVKEAGYFCTSIAYDEGWTMYVDGKETKITPYQDAWIALENLQPGKHTIELKYTPPGFVAGVVVSGVALVAFALWCVIDSKKKKK